MRLLPSAGSCCVTASVLLFGSPHILADESTLPSNIGHHLRQLVDWYQTDAATKPANERRLALAASLPAQNRRAQLDANGSRVVVNFLLDGTQPLTDVRANLEKLGVVVFAQNDTGGPGSVLSARLPLDRAVDASRLAGVHSVTLVRRPQRHIGKVTSQGAGVIKSDLVNSAGYTGKGITVGVLSDSYNLVTPGADDDVKTGDLPGTGNPLGQTTPVNVLADGDSSDSSNTDEGRAMLQIVHDVAPDAALAFATVGATPESFAENIRALRTGANCDVMVDDVSFPEEPFFSDGVIAQAIDDVVNSTSLKGKRVLYYTAAGNQSNGVYLGDFNPVSNAAARAGLSNNNLKLDQVPGFLTGGGFHNYNPKKKKTPIIAQRFTVKGSGKPVKDGSDIVELDFQWDDPFNSTQITTDYNLLVFDADGNYLSSVSGTDNNFNTGMPSEFADLHQAADGSDATYQIVIAKTAAGAGSAVHLRSLAYAESSLYETDNFTTATTPSIYGHEAPPGGDAVAAYDYTKLSEPEDYSSVGPMTVYLDRAGNRLATPDVRMQPTISAPDGVDTTFFPTGGDQDSDNDGFPNFFGTSAAAPHAAGAAALLLQAHGGPLSLTAAQVRSLFQTTAPAHDIDPSFSNAKIVSKDGLSTVTVTATGNSSDNSAHDPKFFSVSFNGPPTRVLRRVLINLSVAGLEFDTSTDTGFPFTISGRGTTIASSDFTANFSGPTGHSNSLGLKFKPGVFFPGDLLTFGVDRDEAKVHSGGNSADALAGATVLVRTVDGGVTGKNRAAFVNTIGTGNTTVDGFGLIDVNAALQKLLGN